MVGYYVGLGHTHLRIIRLQDVFYTSVPNLTVLRRVSNSWTHTLIYQFKDNS